MKFKLSKSLIGQIAAPTCLIAGSAGIIFGISAATFKIDYMNLNNSKLRLNAAINNSYSSQNIHSEWNMNGTKIVQPRTQDADATWASMHNIAGKEYIPYWKEKQLIGPNGQPFTFNPETMEINTPKGDELSPEAKKARYYWSSLVIDGATHTQMDRSFNQSLFQGMIDYINNYDNVPNIKSNDAQFIKPSQDNNTDKQATYRAASKTTRILGLAGFNHVSALQEMFGVDNTTGAVDFNGENMGDTACLLIDGEVANNQNIASVLFRSDQPGFLAALSTCMYFMNNLSTYHDGYRDLSVAVYGGTPIPTVTIYMGGFQRGVEFFNEFTLKQSIIEHEGWAWLNNSTEEPFDSFTNLYESSKYKNELTELKDNWNGSEEQLAILNELNNKLYDEYSIKMIKLGDFGTHFSGTFSSGDAIGITKQYLNRGASAIIAVAGPQTLDSAQEIQNQGSKCIVVGVDAASENSDYQRAFSDKKFDDKTVAIDGSSSAQKDNIVKFSAIKDMRAITDSFLRLTANSQNWDNTNETPWTTTASLPQDKNLKVVPVENLVFEDGQDDQTCYVTGLTGIQAADEYNKISIPATNNAGKTVIGIKTSASNDAQPFNVVNPLVFEYCAETINIGANVFKDCSNTKYLSFTNENITAANINDNAFTGMVDTQKPHNDGYFKVTNDKKASALWSCLNGGQNRLKDWVAIEPDPETAICGTGYKTCGNIQNGLVSVSWDGWYYLAQALKDVQVAYNALPDDENSKPFWEAFDIVAQEYFTTIKPDEDIREAIKCENVKDYMEKIMTFNKESVLYKNYSDINCILGYLMKSCYINFDKTMTVDLDDQGQPIEATETMPLSILDWLRYNMYFSC